MRWMFQKQKQQHQPIAFHDQGWKRAEMAAWDDLWAGLSVMARTAFLDVQPPVRKGANPPSIVLPSPVRETLLGAGLVEEADGRRVRLASTAIGFSLRLHTLAQCRLLDPATTDLRPYARIAYLSHQMGVAFEQVLTKNVGPMPGFYTDEYLSQYVPRRFWPDWVATFLDDIIATQIVKCLDEEGGPIPLASLASRLPKRRPDKVRAALDALVNYLAVVEGLDPTTNALLIGFIPGVRAARAQSTKPMPHPKLTERPAPAEVGPEGGLLILDLRAVLLELAGGPGRVRQDHGLYAKEQDRFLATMLVAPGWSLDEPKDRVQRLTAVVRLIQNRGFVDPIDDREKEMLLRLSKGGRTWLSGGIGVQYDQLYKLYRVIRKEYGTSSADQEFLGTSFVPRKKGNRQKSQWILEDDDRQTIRDAVHRAFARLPEGKYVRLDDFVEFVARGPDNPLLLGTSDASKVEVRFGNRLIPPVAELYEDCGRRLVQDVTRQLVRFGCLRQGREEGGQVVLCRLPWLDVYFDKAKPPPDAPTSATRTIVQPDFSVIVIGIAPAAAADLALFCNRVQGQPGQGAITFQITRESVWRARSTGLTEADLLARLEKHASTPVPPNVKTQIRAWSGQVSNVSTRPGRLFRCPDAATADRVKTLLGKEAERIGTTMVFWHSTKNLPPALRNKFRDQGVFLQAE